MQHIIETMREKIKKIVILKKVAKNQLCPWLKVLKQP
jgi:hypothetical protein